MRTYILPICQSPYGTYLPELRFRLSCLSIIQEILELCGTPDGLLCFNLQAVIIQRRTKLQNRI